MPFVGANALSDHLVATLDCLDFFEIGWSVIVRSDRSASSESKQNYLARERGGFLQWVSIGSSSFAGENCWGGSTSVSTAGTEEIT
jgi:hypothetical protein